MPSPPPTHPHPGFCTLVQLLCPSVEPEPNRTERWSPGLLTTQKSCIYVLVGVVGQIQCFEKVLNWGIGPHEDRTAEMVLILHKRSHVPHFPSVFLCNIFTFYMKCCKYTLFEDLWHFDENNDLRSSKAEQVFYSKGFFPPQWQVST